MIKRGFNGFHSIKSLIRLYSTSSPSPVASKDGIGTPITNPLMVDFLFKSVGFSAEKAASIATKVSRRSNSTKKPELVVDFLKDSGFDETQIRKLVGSLPIVLFCDLEKTLKPKIRVFQELGLSGSDLGLLLARQPNMLQHSLKNQIVPGLEILKSLVGSNEEVVRFLLKAKSQWNLLYFVLKHGTDNFLLLQSYGLKKEKIKWLMLQRPVLLLRQPHWVEKLMVGVEVKLGIPRTSGMFPHGITALSSRSIEKLQSWVQVFRRCGWSKTEVSELLRRNPVTLTLSERELRVKLKYFMEDVGYGSNYLARRPVLLTLSMEKRIVPRIAVIRALREKKLLKREISVDTVLRIVESKFMEKYVLPVKDELPELYEYYTLKKGISLSKYDSVRGDVEG